MDNKASPIAGQSVLQFDTRAEALAKWARSTELKVAIPENATLAPVSDDASFRRYFRFSSGADGLIFVDAPPEHEDVDSFVRISKALVEAGLNAPQVAAVDIMKGFLAISDLGDRLYLDQLHSFPGKRDELYDDAVAAILRMMPISIELPIYDEHRLRDEMSLFHEWFLAGQLGLNLSADEKAMLDGIYDLLVDSALAQPTGFVHRDYHCRNLLETDFNNPGIIDFQDAVIGPVTYDLVSLYKDCYYRFNREVVVKQVDRFAGQLVDLGYAAQDAPVLKWFDLMGAQRHLKCAGIFSRLNLRDSKPRYLADIPLVIEYLVEVSDYYVEMADFGCWLRNTVIPSMQAKMRTGP